MIDVRYPDCDQMGIVHFSVYPIWYEVARMDFFKEMGFSFEAMNALGINPPTVNLNLNYMSPAKYPQRLTIKTRIKSFAKNKLELEYATYKEGRTEPINTATSFHIWVGPDMKSLNMEQTQPEVFARIKAAAEGE